MQPCLESVLMGPIDPTCQKTLPVFAEARSFKKIKLFHLPVVLTHANILYDKKKNLITKISKPQ